MTPSEALMLRLNNGFHSTCGCYEHEYLARHVLVDLAESARWDLSLRRSDYSNERWEHFHTSGETMPPCVFDKFVEFERDGSRFHVNQKFIDAMCKMPNVEVDDWPYDTMPVTELIDCLLTVIRDAPMYLGVRVSLKAIKDSIFLELPETRCELLCRIGDVINRHVPDRTKRHVYVDPFWDRVKVIMEKSFERFR